MTRRLFSLVPTTLREELIKVLEKNKFEQSMAEKIVDSIDSTIRESIHRQIPHFLTTLEYERVIETIHGGVERQRQEISQMEATTSAALATDYDFLLAEIDRTRLRLRDEAHQLESSVQLDLNLERKRRMDLTGEVEGKRLVAAQFLEDKSLDIERHVRQLAKQAMTAIIALGATMVATFVGYKIYTGND